MTQFVPLKVDTATPEYAALQQKHRSEGNTIPKIFVIRADGKKLYAQSGSLSGDQLPSLMAAAVREMGRPLDLGEVKVLSEINQKIETSLEEGDFRTAGTLFKKVKKLGPFGQIKSFAGAAITNNSLAGQMTASVSELVAGYGENLDSENRFASTVKAIQLKSDIGTLQPFRIPLNELEKKLRAACESPQEFSEIRNVATAISKLDHKTRSIRQRAVSTLQSFAEKTENSAGRQYVNDLLKNVPADDLSPATPSGGSGMLRTWTSSDGKFKVEAELLSFDGVTVKLKKLNGDVISVPLNRLSRDDQSFASQKEKPAGDDRP
ncbi:MAG: SHD1 domain-containing protein [Planctomycetota bacterium]|nr:SHD1 domain-containing protein [Planctomycetota bacterium]